VHKIEHVVHMYFPEKLSTVKVEGWGLICKVLYLLTYLLHGAESFLRS